MKLTDLTTEDIKALWYSFTVRAMTIGLTLYTVIDTSQVQIVSLLTDFYPSIGPDLTRWLASYNKIVLVGTMIFTAYGRVRTEKYNIPLTKRKSVFGEDKK